MHLKTLKDISKFDEMAQLRFSKFASHFGCICICKHSYISQNFGEIIRINTLKVYSKGHKDLLS